MLKSRVIFIFLLTFLCAKKLSKDVICFFFSLDFILVVGGASLSRRSFFKKEAALHKTCIRGEI